MTGCELRWPATTPRSGPVSLRPFRETDAEMVEELATDPYVPLIGSLPAHADTRAALAWIDRQHARLAEGVGFSFCIVGEQNRPLGFAVVWTGDQQIDIAWVTERAGALGPFIRSLVALDRAATEAFAAYP